MNPALLFSFITLSNVGALQREISYMATVSCEPKSEIIKQYSPQIAHALLDAQKDIRESSITLVHALRDLVDEDGDKDEAQRVILDSCSMFSQRLNDAVILRDNCVKQVMSTRN